MEPGISSDEKIRRYEMIIKVGKMFPNIKISDLLLLLPKFKDSKTLIEHLIDVNNALQSDQSSNNNSDYNDKYYEVEQYDLNKVCKWSEKNNVLKGLEGYFKINKVTGKTLLEIYELNKYKEYKIISFGIKENFKYEMGLLIGKSNSSISTISKLKPQYKNILDKTIDGVLEMLNGKFDECDIKIFKEKFKYHEVNGIAFLLINKNNIDELNLLIGQRKDLLKLIKSYYN